MSAYVLLILLNDILSLFCNEFNKFNRKKSTNVSFHLDYFEISFLL